MLKLANLETWYDLIQALHGVSLQVAAGSITVILGNNGAGKSTILKTIMGLIDDQPDKGTIHFEGKAIHRCDTEDIVRHGISYVPEGREVFAELSVAENLAVGAYIRRDRKAVASDLEHIFSVFPRLAERKGQLAGTLSGGEQQMLAMGRALMNKPKLLLLDEPSLGLSPKLVDEVFLLIETINRQGLTILLVEQNAAKSLAIAQHGYVLESGRFVLSGSAAELAADENVREFYLGLGSAEGRENRRWKRKKIWA